MIFSFHNQLKIHTPNKSYEFYNNILKSTLINLSNFKKYNEFISIGDGLPNSELQNQFHLSNHIFSSKLTKSSIQSDISKGNLFAKYEFYIPNLKFNSNYITEIGLSDNSDNPIIFNYFSLITDDTPNGINIQELDEILFEITINLNIKENNGIILTSGNNPFIEFLLGNGLQDVFISKGSNFTENVRINRVLDKTHNLSICNKTSYFDNDSLVLNFDYSFVNSGELNEILFVSNNKVFARKNLKEFNPPINSENIFTSKTHYIIKIDEDVKNINSIINNSTQNTESNYFISHYANSFGEKINLPFNNLFNSNTPRYLSKDSKLIFFVLNDKIYGYSNDNFCINELNLKQVTDSYISKIISFENYVFIFSKISPFISSYIISDNTLIKKENNFSSLTNLSEIENCLQIDITHCNNNKFIMGLILQNKTALSIYFDYTNDNNFIVTNQISNDKEFNYILAMLKNNFCDGQIIYLKEGENSVNSRIVTHFSDSTEKDIYSSIAYYLTNNSKNIYCKNRAIISEKLSEPSVVIYYYPQVYEYNLPILSNETKNYISSNLNYVIQQKDNFEFKIYNIVGYDEPEEFYINLSDIVDCSKILDLEIMNDTLLIFLNDNTNPVIAFNFKLDKTQIENLSENNSNYLVNYTKYDKLGKDNNSVNISFSTRISL